MIFYLGTHMPHWLGRTDVPLMVSRRTLSRVVTPPRARGPWVLDSGGFSELSLHGRWTVEPLDYVREVDRWAGAVGNLRWAAIQDWMCEPFILAKTGLGVGDHQRLTVRSYLALRALAPGLPWMPVLQGWSLADYVRHVTLYAVSGVRLADLPVVGIGSVCRRQATREIANIVQAIAGGGIALHGFGVKARGLPLYGHQLASSDSLAWSFQARGEQRPMFPDCTHKNCANCLPYALRWRESILAKLEVPS